MNTHQYGPWAVITGASDGIGRAIATELAAAGFDLVLIARRQAALDALAAELTDAHGISTRVFPQDLATPQGWQIACAATADLDVGLFVASAGFGTSGAFLDADVETELQMVDVNCRAITGMTHHYARRLARRGRGGVILLSSLVAFQGAPQAANYAATKAYIQSLAEGLSVELAEHGVDVLATAPGPVRSGFAARADMKMGQAATPEEVARGTLRALGRRGLVRPGALSKLLAWSLAMLPRVVRVRIMGGIMGGMTGHQRALPAE